MKTPAEDKIFFSYSRADQAFTMRLARDLRAAGVSLWLDQLDIDAGVRWDHAIEEALETSGCLLVILSPTSVASQNVMDEVSYALEEGKQIVPVLYQACKIPFRLRRVQYIDFTGDYDKGFRQLQFALNITNETQSGRLRAITKTAPAPEAAPPASAGPEAPAADAPVQSARAAAVRPARRRDRRALRATLPVVGAAAAIALGVVLAPLVGLRLSGRGAVPPSEDNHAFVRVATFTVTPSELALEEGRIETINVDLLDETGAPIRQADPQQVQWRISDTQVATIIRLANGEANVTAMKPGSAVIKAQVAGLEQSIPLTVLFSQETKNAASSAYFSAMDRRRDPALSDPDVLADFEQVQAQFGNALDAVMRSAVDSTISRLKHSIKTYRAVAALEASDTLAVLEKRAHWQAYLDEAFRESPATTHAQQRIAAIDQVEQTSATLVDNTLFTCKSIADKQCAERHRTDAFAPGSNVYVSASIKTPRSDKISIDWYDPAGEQIQQKQSTISTSRNYRVWYSLNGTETTRHGTYEIRIFNSDDVLIGRHTFTVGR